MAANRAPIYHELKSWPGPFEDVKSRGKDFEVRRDDRDFQKGDIVGLREFRPVADAEVPEFRPVGYTGNYLGPFRITFISRGGAMPEGWCAFRIVRLVMKVGG